MKKSKNLTAVQKRSLLKNIFEESFGLSVYVGSSIEKYIDEEFKRGNKSKLNEALTQYCQKEETTLLATAIVESMKDYPDLKTIHGYLVDTVPVISDLINFNNSSQTKKAILAKVIDSSIKSLKNMGLRQDSYEISKLMSVYQGIDSFVDITLLGNAMKSLGNAIDRKYVNKIGELCVKLAPCSLTIGNVHAKLEDKIDAVFLSLSYLGSYLKIQGLELVTKTLRNISWLRILNPFTNENPGKLDDVLCKIGMPLGSNSIVEIKKSLRTNGANEQEVANAVNIISNLSKNKLAQQTRMNQKIAAASSLLLNIAADIKYKPLENLAHVGISYACTSQLYLEIKSKSTNIYSLSTATGMLLQSAGSLLKNNKLMHIGNSIMCGLKTAEMMAMLPGGAVLSIPAGIIAMLSSIFSKNKQQIEVKMANEYKNILIHVQNVNNNLQIIHQQMINGFSSLFDNFIVLNRSILESMDENFKIIKYEINKEMHSINKLININNDKLDKISTLINNRFRELYENNIIAKIRRYEINKITNIKQSEQYVKELLSELVYWIKYESFRVEASKINFAEIKEEDVDVVFNQEFNLESNDLDHISIMLAYLKHDKAIGFNDNVSFPNISIWFEAVNTLFNILIEYENVFVSSLASTALLDIVVDCLQDVRKNLIEFAQNERLLNHLEYNVNDAYFKFKNYIDDNIKTKAFNYWMDAASLIARDKEIDVFISKFSNVEVKTDIFGIVDSKTNLDLSAFVRNNLLDEWINNPEIFDKLNLINIDVSISGSSEFFISQFVPCLLNDISKEIARLKLNLNFYLDDNSVKKDFYSISLNVFAGGTKTRNDFYRARYVNLPSNPYMRIHSSTVYTRFCTTGNGPQDYLGEQESYCGSEHPDLKKMQSFILNIGVILTNSLSNGDFKFVSKNIADNFNIDSGNEAILQKGLKLRFDFVNDFIKNEEFKTEFEKIDVYIKILNTMYAISGVHNLLPSFKTEVKRILYASILDDRLENDFYRSILFLNPKQAMLENIIHNSHEYEGIYTLFYNNEDESEFEPENNYCDEIKNIDYLIQQFQQVVIFSTAEPIERKTGLSDRLLPRN